MTCGITLYPHRNYQIIFAVLAWKTPESIPMSLASLTLIRAAVGKIATDFFQLLAKMNEWGLDDIRTVYELSTHPNVVVDGSVELDCDQLLKSPGLSLEFR